MKTRFPGSVAVAPLGVVLAFTVLSIGCSPQEGTKAPAPDSTSALAARAILDPRSGSGVRGEVAFYPADDGDGVRVHAQVSGLTPGQHGMHVHETGNCSADDASSAGGHFNPTGQAHGDRDAQVRHIGDLGNLEADAEGNARLDYVDKLLRLDGPNSIVGRALIIHADPDDLTSQPSGNAGGRVACGVIERHAKH